MIEIKELRRSFGPVIAVDGVSFEVEKGQVIEAVTTDPGSLTDFPAWARTNGHEIIDTVQGDDAITFYIKRLT